MNTTHKLALAEIVEAMKEVAVNLESCVDAEGASAYASAMFKLACAYSVVKRGTMLPDWIREAQK